MLEKALRDFFGYQTFRPGQEEIIQTILSGRDTLAVLPTGGGKSICYQLPALLLDGLTLVISPLISLMQDQIDVLSQLKLPAASINSATSQSDYFHIIQQVKNGNLKLLYVAPERLTQPSFTQFAAQLPISLLAVDEAHCVSQWGHDFRPSYHQISEFIQQLNSRPTIAAFTATATGVVQEDIITQLQLVQPARFINSFDRPYITFQVVEPSDRFQYLTTMLTDDQPTIIYCNTRKLVDDLTEKLAERGYQVAGYHAGMSQEERAANQDAFIHDRITMIVATNAFGMGIDKPDVRQVIHYTLPTDLEGYYQEAGRAGRDGSNAIATLMYGPQDIMTNKFIIDQSLDPNRQMRLDTMIRYANYAGCLRQFILNYFGEHLSEPCGNCSNCLGKVERIDVTRPAQIILSTIIRMNHSYGMTLVTQVVRGSRDQKVLNLKFDQLSTYGMLKDYTVQRVRDIISALVADNYISMTEYRGLFVTDRARSVLTGDSSVMIKKRANHRTATHVRRVSNHSQNDELYEQLRQMRLELAKEENILAYMVFSNKTLEDMIATLPTDFNQLLEVDGVGTVKAEKYGGYFLGVIQTYLKQNKSSQSISNQHIPSAPVDESQLDEYLQMYQEDMTPIDISIELNHSIHQVRKGFIELIRQEEIDDYIGDISRSTYLVLSQQFAQEPEITLEEAMHRFSPKHSRSAIAEAYMEWLCG